ncbi:unnamed protein product, partial [Polarella glacialis]
LSNSQRTRVPSFEPPPLHSHRQHPQHQQHLHHQQQLQLQHQRQLQHQQLQQQQLHYQQQQLHQQHGQYQQQMRHQQPQIPQGPPPAQQSRGHHFQRPQDDPNYAPAPVGSSASRPLSRAPSSASAQRTTEGFTIPVPVESGVSSAYGGQAMMRSLSAGRHMPAGSFTPRIPPPTVPSAQARVEGRSGSFSSAGYSSAMAPPGSAPQTPRSSGFSSSVGSGAAVVQAMRFAPATTAPGPSGSPWRQGANHRPTQQAVVRMSSVPVPTGQQVAWGAPRQH